MSKKKLFKAEFLLLCDYAYTAEGNKLSIVGKFDILNVVNFPIAHAEMFLVACFIGEENSLHNLQLKVLDPSGSNLVPNDIPAIPMKLSPTGTGNFMHRMLNFPVKQAGEYKFILMSENETVGSTTLKVLKSASPAGEKSTN